MRRILTIGLIVASGSAVLAPASAVAQPSKAYPTRPVRIILPFPPGGSLDALGRAVFDKTAEALGQRVLIDYRPGASGNIGTELVARAAPDGYTHLLNTLPLVVNPSIFRKLPFDVTRDFAPVSLIAYCTNPTPRSDTICCGTPHAPPGGRTDE